MKLVMKEKTGSALQAFKTSFFALLFALLIGAGIIAISGYSPLSVYESIFVGSFGTKKGFILALSQATPLMFTGLAFAIAYKVKMINTGAEGQLHMGAMAAALVGVYVTGLPGVLHVPLALAASLAVGALIGFFVAWLKVRFGAGELVTTLMLNEIFKLFTSYLCNGPFQAQDAAVPQTEMVQKTARLMKLADRSQLTIALLVAIGCAVILQIVLTRTALGYEMQVTGNNLRSARTAGINVGKVYMITFAISGGVAALCGASFALGVNGRFLEGFSNNSGFAGISVAALAAYNPIGVVFSSILFGALKAGAMTLNRATRIPIEFVDVIQALVVCFVAAPRLVSAILGVFKKLKPKKKSAPASGAASV